MAKAGYIHISTITMDGIYWSFQMITVFLTYVAGNPVQNVFRRFSKKDCSGIDTFERPQCHIFLENALSKDLETAEGVQHYCQNMDFYPHCLRRHTNDYKYMHRCGAFGEQRSMPDTDKWFDLIYELQIGFKEVVCSRSPKDFLEAINCYKHNASHVIHTCASQMPEQLEYLFYQNPGGDADISFNSYTYCSWLWSSSNCMKTDVNSVCGDETRDLLNDAYRVLVNGVFSRAFDCNFVSNTS